MTSDDIYAADFPHGTRLGFAKGCKTKAVCANLNTDVQTCKEANMRHGHDWEYDNLIKEGLTELKADAKLRADAVPEEKPAKATKPRAVPKPAFSKAQLAATVTPVPDVDEETGDVREETAADNVRATAAALGVDADLAEDRIDELSLDGLPVPGIETPTVENATPTPKDATTGTENGTSETESDPDGASEAGAVDSTDYVWPERPGLTYTENPDPNALTSLPPGTVFYNDQAAIASLTFERETLAARTLELETQLEQVTRQRDKHAESIRDLEAANLKLVEAKKIDTALGLTGRGSIHENNRVIKSPTGTPITFGSKDKPAPAPVEPTAEATLVIDPTEGGGIRVALYGLGARDLGMTLVFAEHGLQDVDVQVGA